MKQQTTVIIEKVTIDGEIVEPLEQTDITLEFSAIDTGGGFHDPILDFTYKIPVKKGETTEQAVNHIVLVIRDPSDRRNTVTLVYEGKLKQEDGKYLRGMGRLQNGRMSRDIVKFVMRCLR